MMKKRNQRESKRIITDSPKKLSFELIKFITNDFSDELGRGAFGQVFKGVLEDGEVVAVKMLRFMPNINDHQFENEFKILKGLNHYSIIRLVGFCDEAEEELAEYKGKLIVCLRIHRALCLEYMANGSLGMLLSGEYLANNWVTRYKIIKSICEGLEYLQEGLEFPILHLDLKPENILLDGYMRAKISDFGTSRLIGEENSKETLTPLAGTIGYMPPEFIGDQVISKEYDIYSLGVIIKEIATTGISGCSDVADMTAKGFVEQVHDNWKNCMQGIPMFMVEEDCQQVKTCMEIARTCMENDRHKRPTITDIVSQLPRETIFFFRMETGSPIRLLPRAPFKPKKQISSTNMHKDPPPEMSHPAHPEHKLKLVTDAGEPFLCHGCKEPGYGPRYTCDYCGGGKSCPFRVKAQAEADNLRRRAILVRRLQGARLRAEIHLRLWQRDQSFVLHTRCALAGDPLFDLHTLVLPLFGYGKQLEFSFLHQAAASSSSVSVQEEGSRTRLCDACGAATRGFVYHCSEQDVDIHPCCASLPDRFVHDGRAFDLHRRASRPCALCLEDEEQRRWFWAYRSYVDGEAVDLHVACLKETARRSWENQDMGDGAQINVDGMLENKFGEVAGTVTSFITALVFGNLIVKI